VGYATLKADEFVLDFEFLALERRDEQVVLAEMCLLRLDFAVELLVTPLKCGDMAFSRHDNSLSNVSDDSIVTNLSHFVDRMTLRVELPGAKPGALS
jgi:hypothetical protein